MEFAGGFRCNEVTTLQNFFSDRKNLWEKVATAVLAIGLVGKRVGDSDLQGFGQRGDHKQRWGPLAAFDAADVRPMMVRSSPKWQNGDFSGDGEVNMDDLDLFFAQYGLEWDAVS